ncbi:uncharacterized protein LOC119341225 isoform X2 [Triticum dicoccoides]|uniref:uncharacterized protein LOC119341225 isoform X2 n=1 Tax=Triticum dicoccoides TaxID=85692 RepID=UPI0018912561|nr:uncharacterized protein LOC119341225 isoform X2 [Triticum dicoccoides]
MIAIAVRLLLFLAPLLICGRCCVEAAPAPLLLASSRPPLLPVEHGLLLAIGPPPVNPEDDMHGSLGSTSSSPHGPPPRYTGLLLAGVTPLAGAAPAKPIGHQVGRKEEDPEKILVIR